MERKQLIELLQRKPGYEAVYLLYYADEPVRRKTLAAYVGTDGGTLQRWVDKAVKVGLVSKITYIHDETEKKCVEYTLNSLPRDILLFALVRGRRGPRESHGGFADRAQIHEWNDDLSLDRMS